MQRNRIAHFREGNSDKIYMVGIAEASAGAQFEVVAKWGRRGGNFQAQIKGTYPSESGARRAMNDLIGEKLSKGYEDIESTSYRGVVTIAHVQKHLQKEDGVSTAPARTPIAEAEAKPTFDADAAIRASSLNPGPLNGKTFAVRCVNNVGIEDRFDLAASYQAAQHRDTEMLFVTDKTGNRDEFFADRFVRV